MDIHCDTIAFPEMGCEEAMLPQPLAHSKSLVVPRRANQKLKLDKISRRAQARVSLENRSLARGG